MPSRPLQEVRLDFARAAVELQEFGHWLAANPEFSERRVVEQIKPRRDLCLLIQLAAGKGRPDRIKHEFSIQGVFRADLVIGSTSARHFVLVEFESGEEGSIFNQRRGTAQLRAWASGVEHAFSQVSDWTWAKNEGQSSALYRNAFGLERFSETYLVVCGREAFLTGTDAARLHWRSEKTTIAACQIRFWTYDDLLRETAAALDIWRSLKDEDA